MTGGAREAADLLAAVSASAQAAARAMTVATEAMALALRRMGAAYLRALRGDLILVVPDPADRRPTNVRAWACQARDILLHDFWIAAERPERAPGAALRRKRGRP